MACGDAALSALCDPVREVSAHYLITQRGDVYQLVDEAERAWHAGAGVWEGARDVNSRSIGIELSNDGYTPFSAMLMDRLEPLLAGIMERWGIDPKAVIAHSDCAPGRKIDPGGRFDWQRLARSGLAIWPEDIGDLAADPAQFYRDLHRFGYSEDVAGDVLLDAFRLHFAPALRGQGLSARDMGLAAGLAKLGAIG